MPFLASRWAIRVGEAERVAPPGELFQTVARGGPVSETLMVDGNMTDPTDILLVDDDPQVVQYLKQVLEDAGYSVTATTSGKRARAFIKGSPPALMILDLNMPKPDGFEILKTTHSEFPFLRILVISGYLHGSLLEAASVFGAIATLEKPVDAEALIRKVRDVLGR